jgi:uncharacterized membrane protein
MFHRITIAEWQSLLTIVSFAIFGIVFLAMFARACLLPKRDVQKLSQLPLHHDTES